MLIQQQFQLALEKRRHIIHLRQKQVIDAHEFLAILHRFQEKAIVIQERHVLIAGGIECRIEILTGGIGAAILHIQMSEQAKLVCRRATLQAIGALGLQQGNRIRTLRRHNLGKLKGKETAVRVRFSSVLPEHVRKCAFATQFHFLGADKRFMSRINILRQGWFLGGSLLDRIKLRIHRLCNRNGVIGRQDFALFRRRGTTAKRQRHHRKRYHSRKRKEPRLHHQS